VLDAKEPPFVQLTVGPDVTPASSVAVRVAVAVCPDATVRDTGLKVTTGAVVSGLIVTVKVAVPSLPAASLAVAVHSLVVVLVTAGAVKVSAEKAPPLVQLTVGPDVTATLSVAVRLEVPVPVDTTVKEAGLKVTLGADVSGGGGGGGGGGTELPPDPPPQETITMALNVMAVVLSKFFKATMRSPL
jgi:hypothetical protein